MDWSLAEQDVDLDGIYYCPHHSEGKGEYKEDCDCRKPKSGMLLQAIKELKIDPRQSIMVGDKVEDLKAGIGAKVKMNVLVRTGKTSNRGRRRNSGLCVRFYRRSSENFKTLKKIAKKIYILL